MRDRSKWRTGIEVIQQGSAGIRQGINNLQQIEAQNTQTQQQKGERFVQGITSGLQQLDTALANQKKRAQEEEDHKLRKEAALRAQKYEETNNPLKLRTSELQIQNMELDQKIKKETYTSSKKNLDAANEATIRGFESNSKALIPDNWDAMTASQKAAYASTAQSQKVAYAEEARKTVKAREDSALTRAQIQTAKLTAATKELEIDKKMSEIMDAPDVVKAQAYKENPALASMPITNDRNLQRVYSTEQKKQEAAFAEKVMNPVTMAFDNQKMVRRIAKLGGVNKLNPDGTIPPEQLDKWNQAGFEGILKDITNDQDRQVMKAEMIGFVKTAAQEGTYGALNFASEVKRAKDDAATTGLVPESPEYWEAVTASFFGKGKVGAFFERQASIMRETRDKAQQAFVENNGFSYVGKGQTNGAMYMMSPYSLNAENKMSPQDFANLQAEGMPLGQAQANAVWGFDPKTGEPNYKIPEGYSEAAHREQLAARGELFTDSSQREFSFENPILKEKYAGVKERRAQAEAYNTPAAKVGLDPQKPIDAGSGINPANPNQMNPNTPTRFDAQSGGYQTITQPSLKSASGATPTGGKAQSFKKTVVEKYRLHPQWEEDVSGIFQGYSPTGKSGTATASP